MIGGTRFSLMVMGLLAWQREMGAMRSASRAIPLQPLPRRGSLDRDMPPLTRWFIKTAMASLVLAFLVRATMAALPFWDFLVNVTALAPVFLHLFMWGWVTQLIFGVAYRMFPKYSKPSRTATRDYGWLPSGFSILGWYFGSSANRCIYCVRRRCGPG